MNSVEQKQSLIINNTSNEIDINFEDIINNGHISFSSHISFRWLNKFMLWFPLWCTVLPPSNQSQTNEKLQKRSKYLNIIASIVSLLLITLNCFGRQWYFVTTYSDLKSFQSKDILNQVSYDIYSIISNGCYGIARYIGFYYFYKYFNFPWYDNDIIHSKDYKTIYSTSKRLKIFIVSTFLLQIAWGVTRTIYDGFSADNQWGSMGDAAWLIFNDYVIEMSLIFTQCCCSVMFLKYYLFIKEVMIDIENNENVNFKKLLTEYCTKKQEFTKLYKIWSYYFVCLLISIFCWLWIGISEILYTNHDDNDTDTILAMVNYYLFLVLSIVSQTIPLVEFFVSASMITETFDKLKHSLFHYQQKHDMKDCKYYHYSLHYINTYPFHVTIFGWKVCKINALKLLVVFIIAKTVTYSYTSVLL
eukprot:279361_1